MRKALVVGIDFYEHVSPLHGCVNDAHAVAHALATHADGSVNFGVKLLTATDGSSALTRGTLKDAISDLFGDDHEVALLYFAGHGHIEATGGYLCGSECSRGDDGLPLADVLSLANASPSKNKVILLDSCHSGIAGTPTGQSTAALAEGMTILTAATANQYATEKNGTGLFTSLLLHALEGAAANLVGEVTPGSVYAHIDQSLGAWEQRPVFKTNVKSFVSLRTAQPPIALADLKQIATLFPEPGFEFQLDPSFEPETAGRPENAPPPDLRNTMIFAVLQKYNRLGLLVPLGAPHMWNAAIESKACKLTAFGEHYRRLVADGLI